MDTYLWESANLIWIYLPLSQEYELLLDGSPWPRQHAYKPRTALLRKEDQYDSYKNILFDIAQSHRLPDLKSKGFIFDLVFKLQAPITIYGEIKSTYSDEEALYAGVDFAGNSSRKDEMKRFYATIKPMEAEYKAKLIKSLKTPKK